MQMPVLSLTITPKTKADEEKLRLALSSISADPTVRLEAGPDGEVTIAGMGELHLEIILERMKREFDVDAAVSIPRVIYRQTPGPDGVPITSEPIMCVEVVFPNEYARDVTDNLAQRHGEIVSREDRNGTPVVTARVPLSQLFGYASDLRDRTLGRGTFTMRFDRYRPVGGPDGGGDRDSYVGWPNTPKRPLKSSAIALPEPD